MLMFEYLTQEKLVLRIIDDFAMRLISLVHSAQSNFLFRIVNYCNRAQTGLIFSLSFL